MDRFSPEKEVRADYVGGGNAAAVIISIEIKSNASETQCERFATMGLINRRPERVNAFDTQTYVIALCALFIYICCVCAMRIYMYSYIFDVCN